MTVWDATPGMEMSIAYRSIIDAARERRGMRPLPVSGIVGMGYRRRPDDLWFCDSCECCMIDLFDGRPRVRRCLACTLDSEHALKEAERVFDSEHALKEAERALGG